MNWPDWAVNILALTTGMGILTAGFGYFIGTFRKNKYQAVSDESEGWKGEFEAQRTRADRFEAENRAKDVEISNLKGQVEQLSNRVADLSGLIMGEKVQPALKTALENVAAEQHGFTRDHIDVRFERFQKAFLEGLMALSHDFKDALRDHFPAQEKPE